MPSGPMASGSALTASRRPRRQRIIATVQRAGGRQGGADRAGRGPPPAPSAASRRPARGRGAGRVGARETKRLGARRTGDAVLWAPPHEWALSVVFGDQPADLVVSGGFEGVCQEIDQG